MKQPAKSWKSGMRSILLLLPLTMLMTGCLGSGAESATLVKPRFPAPEDGVVEKIQRLDDPAVDRWMIQVANLCRKLEGEEVC